MKRVFAVMITLFLLSTKMYCAEVVGSDINSDKEEITYDYVIKKYIEAGYKFDSSINGKESFKSPQEAYTALKNDDKELRDAIEGRRKRKETIELKNVSTIGELQVKSFEYGVLNITFFINKDTGKIERGLETHALVGTFFGFERKEYDKGELKMKVSKNGIEFNATPYIISTVIINGNAYTKKFVWRKYSFSVNLKKEKVVAREYE